MAFIKSSTIQLLRFHFSFFLMPVYWFALGQTNEIDINNAIICFIILHLLVYPSSNGYNSFMDRDTSSIGGLKNPQAPTKQLFYFTIVMDVAALLLSLAISTLFFAGILLYIAASRAYSYRGIRLKRYPIAGFLTVIIYQGGLVYFLISESCDVSKSESVDSLGMLAATLLVGGFYPLTQIYQHEEDKKDGVETISYMLGYNGTFIFTAIIYSFAIACIGYVYWLHDKFDLFLILNIFLLPVLVYFGWWFLKVASDAKNANFLNTMRMNVIASLLTNAAYITLLIIDN